VITYSDALDVPADTVAQLVELLVAERRRRHRRPRRLLL